jgi:hypothetical protein
MRMHYMFGMLDFGTAGEIFSVIGPKGRKGKLVDYGVHSPVETFTATTLPAYVSVGSAADADLYAEELSMGTLADQAGGKSARTTATDPTTLYENGNVYMLEAAYSLPADTAICLHCTAPTGGTPAGMAYPFMIIDWED